MLILAFCALTYRNYHESTKVVVVVVNTCQARP